MLIGNGLKDRPLVESLVRLAPGDWRVTGEFQWIRLGTETRSDVLDLLDEHLVTLL